MKKRGNSTPLTNGVPARGDYHAFEKELDVLRKFRGLLQCEEYKRAFDVAIMAIRLLRGEPSDREMAEKHLTYDEWKEILKK